MKNFEFYVSMNKYISEICECESDIIAEEYRKKLNKTIDTIIEKYRKEGENNE